MNKYLAYQFVGKSEGLHKLPDHIQKIKRHLGYDEKERSIVEDLMPQLKQRIRAQSIPDKPIPKQIQINTLTKRLATLRQDYDKVCIELMKHQSFRTNVKNPKTNFEQHFYQIDNQIHQWEEQKELLSKQIKMTKKELFLLENQSETYTTKKIGVNQSVLLSELVTIQKRIPAKLPKLEKSLKTDLKLLNNTQESNLVELFDSDEDQDLRPRTRTNNKIYINKKLPTLEEIIDQLDNFIVKSDTLLQSKEALKQFRLQKYEKYLKKRIYSEKKIKNIRYCFIVVFFSLCLIKQTKISQQRYKLICYSYHQQHYQKANQEIIFFVNNIIAKQVLFKFSRLQQLQKAERKQNKIMIPMLAEEIVREIIQRITTQKFSHLLYQYLHFISTESFYPLFNYHCEIIKSRQNISSYFGYNLIECKRIVFFEFIIIKNVLFYGLFFKAKELFTQLNIDSENELIHSIVITILELFLRTLQSGVLNVNLKNFCVQQTDGQQVFQQLKEINQNKVRLLSTLQIEDLIKPFIQMIEKQFIHL